MTSKGDITAQQGSTAASLIIDSVVQTINIQGGSLTNEEAKQHESQYLQRIMQDCAGLEWLRLVRKQDEKTPAMGLDSIYTALLTHSLAVKEIDALDNRERGQPQLSALEVLNQNQRLVLTGTPGSGKSVFVNYLVLCLAGENLGVERANLSTLTEPLPSDDGRPETEKVAVGGTKEKREIRQPWDHQALIPVRIILRDFAVSSYFPENDQQADANCILNFLNDNLQNKACGQYFQILEAYIRAGEALVMFDGLDEVAQAGERRKRLIACIHGFVKSFSKARFLVTCRPFAYTQDDWQLEQFADASLADFSRGQMIRFIQRWYGNSPEFEEDQAERRAGKLQAAIFRRDSLLSLAKRPLLLSLIAYLHANRHELPERRADLYERLLELLIDEWEKARFKTEDSLAAHECEQHSLAEFLQIGQDTIRLVLERLAFQAHTKQSINSNAVADADTMETANIAASDLSHQLLCAAKAAGQDNIHPLDICEYLRDRVGILYQRGGASELDAVYTFPHRSFQEYLTAAYFRRTEKSMLHDYPEHDEWQTLAAYLGSSDPDRWREVIILAGGIKAQKDPSPVWDLLDALYPEVEDQLSKEHAWALRLAAEILAENLKHDELGRKQQRIFDRFQQVLPAALETAQLPAVERVAVGKHLAVIGDPRKAITDIDEIQFCQVSAGSFWMGKGTADKDDEVFFGKEKPAGNYDLHYDYFLGKYPVTVAQFQQFVKDSHQQPGDEDCLKGSLNDPVVWVDWHEAMAFCNWLTQRWQNKGCLPNNWRVTLPNEPEWEKAARGGFLAPSNPVINPVCTIGFVDDSTKEVMNSTQLQTNPLPQRRYPWGNKLDDEYLNYAMKIGHVSTPGIYSSGQSVYGCEDLSGNVWEWTRSQDGNYPYPETGSDEWQKREAKDSNASRVVRGGAFDLNLSSVRTAVRFDLPHPAFRDLVIGFRVCLSPFPLTDEPLDAESLNR
ncbi:MAG: SUMF1/EgtB/PvdO family nonheme iron enzyme [Methylococcales bacterium]